MSEILSTNVNQNQMSIFDKILNVFFAPRKTFESINQKPDWLVPMIIVVVVALVFTTLIMPVVMPEQMAKQRTKLEQQGMSSEQIDRSMEIGMKAGKIMGPVGAVFGTVIYLLIISGILLFVGNIILGGKTTFKKLLSVVSYSSLIGSVYSLILLPLILAKKTMEVHFSLATFMSNDAANTLMYQFLKKIDLFSLWGFIVMGIGFGVVYNFTTKKSVTTMIVLYIIYILISLLLFKIFN
jgi:hypothetical protein